MNRQGTSLRTIGMLIGLLALSQAGCRQTASSLAGPAPDPAPRQIAAEPAPTTRPASAGPVGKQVMARVNGKPVYMEQLVEILLRGEGLGYARRLVRNEQVRQELQKEKIVVTDADAAAEQEMIVAAMAPTTKTPQERRRVLEKLCAEKGMPRQQWFDSVRLACGVRKLVERGVRVTEELMRKEFNRRHGRQVVVRDIEVKSLTKAEQVLRQLDAGGDFAALAWKHSLAKSASKGGLMPPIGPRSGNVPTALREAALALSKVGEVSDPVLTGRAFHLLKAERFIQPKKVKFEDVKDKIAADIRKALIIRNQQLILRGLAQQAKVEFVDPILKHLDEQERRQQKQQQAMEGAPR